MIVLKETIVVQNELKRVFLYTSAFENIHQWDPGVAASTKTGSGDLRVGTAYDLVLRYGPFRPRMRYVVTSYDPFNRVVLKGIGSSFSAQDTILFAQTSQGIRIDYQAIIRFFGLFSKIEPLLAPFLREMGRRAMQGLEKTLDPAAARRTKEKTGGSGSSGIDYLADHTILPGLLMFTKYGYAMGKQFWKKDTGILYGKEVVITGGTSGIGKAAAFALAQKRASLTLIARNQAKALKVKQEIIEETGNPQVEVLVADLSLMADIRKVSRQLAGRKIDILINNAGALFNERRETLEGFEQTFVTDLLGVFFLTQNLIRELAMSGNGRIINVSSGGMYTQKIDLFDLQNKRAPYDGPAAYARAKRGVVILTALWAERLRENKIVVHAMHPGWVDTPGIESSLPGFHALTRSVLRSPAQGADTIVWLAWAREPGLCTGRFWLDRRPHETHVFPWTRELPGEQQALWKRLEALIQPF